MSNLNKKEIIILGGGISGLATAWYLHKAGISFKLIEKEEETGGVISSQKAKETVFDFGPNSLRDHDGFIRELAEEAGLKDDIIQISEAFKTRFIVRNRELQRLTPSVKTLATTEVLSVKAKVRMLAEPFIPKGETEDESVGAFLERRIGKEAVEYLVDPVFSGIYAGDIFKMSKYEILPKLAETENKFGSLVMGMFRSKREKSEIKPMILTFKKGIQQLTNAVTEKLSAHILNEEVINLKKIRSGFEVKTDAGTHQASTVITCLPAYTLCSIMSEFNPELSQTLGKIDYAPMLSTQVIFNKKDIEFPESGFGFLVPRKENIRLLGAIWKSSIFPELTSEGKLHYTLMAGGAHDRSILSSPVEKIEEAIVQEFSELMGISANPTVIKSKLWTKAIPQFQVGYGRIRNEITKSEQENQGLYVGGNYRWGVSVPDCVKGAKELVNDVLL
ncbi:MAG: protoporphyrinogen oxidase [Gracilimonas sp.]|uniref:protoporphyrinogen oxidase n=1 Tax=Gracilimonas sp. TaxID=1974203 RepID=UPI0019C79177|nr:protoporphyrinogen oxidase [Gracilimonas sp.]MBD3616608.1 protoporphyrinogen oxidase [Gracilimonas sp.]